MDPQPENYEDLHNKPFLATQQSLEHLAARTVTIFLLKNTINQLRVEDNFFSDSCMISLVLRFKTLEIPKIYENKLFSLLKIIYQQIRLGCFLMYQRIYNEDPSTSENYQTHVYLKNLVWTSNGTINLDETAKSIIKSGLLTDEERYTIACRYSITESIYELAPKIITQSYLDSVDPYFDPLIFFWSCCASGQVDRLKRFPLILYPYFLRFAAGKIPLDWCSLVIPGFHFRQVLSMNRGSKEHYHCRLQRTTFKEKGYEILYKALRWENFLYLDSLALELDVEDGRNLSATNFENPFHEHPLLSQLALVFDKNEEVNATQSTLDKGESAIEATVTYQLAELRRRLDYLSEVVFQNTDEAFNRGVSKSEYEKYESHMHRTWSAEEFARERVQFAVQQQQNSEELEHERCTRIVIERDAELGNGCSANANSRNVGTDAGLWETIFEYFIVGLIFCLTFLVLPIAVTVVMVYLSRTV